MNKLHHHFPAIFHDIPEVTASLTLRHGTLPPYADTPLAWRSLEEKLPAEAYRAIKSEATTNRQILSHQLLGPSAQASFARQTHSDIIVEATAQDIEGNREADALLTTQTNLLIGVFVADCAGILLYDPIAKVVASVHSGWRGTRANIVSAAIARMQTKGADPHQIRVYISPVACPKHYEVGPEFRDFFPPEFLPAIDGRIGFDNQAAIIAQLHKAGVTHIERDQRCTVEEQNLHSYRRDGWQSGRMLACIGLRT